MSLFTMLFPKTAVQEATGGYFDTLTAYTPRFTSFNGGVYEAALCRSAIHTFATQVSKLELNSDRDDVRRILHKPNPWATTSQFLYKLATTLECENTAFIFPILDPTGEKIIGIVPINPSDAKVKEYRGKQYLEAKFPHGKVAIVELSRVGILTKFQYKDPFFGSKDNPLRPTLQLIDTQEQGIMNGVKTSAGIRFLAKIANTLKPADLEAERQRFVSSNLTSSNNGGVLMFDAKYSDVKQIESKPFVIDDRQMALINENVYTYFGTNKKILMSDFTEDEWNAYYEAKIEPFAIQLSQVLTALLFTPREIGFGNEIIASANRLQYASTATKLAVVQALMDRGVMSLNQACDVFQMPHVEGGDRRFIRLEYTDVANLDAVQGQTEAPTEEEGEDENA